MKKIMVLLSVIIFSSCSSKIYVGDVNMLSGRNIESNVNYVMLRSHMGGTNAEINRSRKYRNTTLDKAIDQLVKQTPGGEYIKNAKVYLVDRKYFSIEGDIWGISGVKETYRGFSLDDHVIYKNNGKVLKGKLVGLKDDRICFFQEFGNPNTIQMYYQYITKTTFEQKEIDEYIASKIPPEPSKSSKAIKKFFN